MSLAVRSPVFKAMFAQHWSEQAASSSSSSSDGSAITIEGTAPAAFKQLLRFAYTGHGPSSRRLRARKIA